MFTNLKRVGKATLNCVTTNLNITIRIKHLKSNTYEMFVNVKKIIKNIVHFYT